jgi:hypothetical protein
MHLQAVDANPPEFPRGTALAGSVRRPGDVHDVIAIPDGVRGVIERKAETSSIPSALAATLLVELHLLERDVADAPALMPVAPEPVVDLRLAAAHANYLRALTWHRPGFVPFVDGTAALPVRLLARLTAETITDAARGDLELALRWESAAIAAGRGMAELGLLCALTLARSA